MADSNAVIAALRAALSSAGALIKYCDEVATVGPSQEFDSLQDGYRQAVEALHRADLAQASSSVPGQDDYILRVAIVVRPETTSTQLTFAPQTTFSEGRRAVAQAAASLEAQRAESVNCPAWRNDFVDAPSPT